MFLEFFGGGNVGGSPGPGGRTGGTGVVVEVVVEVVVVKGGVCVWMFGGKTPRLLAASPLLCCFCSLFFTRGNVFFPHAVSGGEGPGGGVDTPGRAVFTPAVFWRHVRPLLVHRAERLALRFSSIFNC